MADSASQSASQIAALAGNVESLTNQLVSTSEKVDATAVAVDAHVASLDERIRVVERTAFSSASALDLTMENVERLRAAKDSVEEGLHQHGAAVSEIRNEFEQIGQRVAAGESTQGSLAVRIEDIVAQLEARDADDSIDRRLQGMEHVLSDIMGRLEHTEHTSTATSASVEQTLRELAASVEAADERNRDTVRELQTAVQDAAAKVAAVEEKLSAPPQLSAAVPEATAASEPVTPAAANSAQPGKMILDAPPFMDHAAPAHDFVSDFHTMTGAAHDFAAAASAADTGDLPPFPTEDVPASAAFSEPFAASEGFLGEPESFLATARRSANAAAVEKEAVPPQSGMFPWTVPGEKTATTQPGRKRFAVAASVFAAAVAAALGGVVLTRGMGSTDPHAATVAAISQPLSAHSASVAPPTTAEPGLSSGPRRTATNDDEAPAAQLSAPGKSDVAAIAPSAVHETQTSKTRPADISERMTPPAAKALAAGRKSAANPVAAPAPNSPAQRIVALANTGDSRAQLVLGMKYLEGSGTQINEAEAARWLARAAQQGEPLAQYRLGTLYERGRGVPTNGKLATHWYDLAAKQGNRKAMHNLAVAFAEGSGEPKDDAQAAIWFAHAANLGLADSQFNLAVLYERGMGVKQSLADAYKWYLVAAAQGDAESKSRAEALATQLNDSDRAAAQAAAAAFKPQPLVPAANSLPVLG
jgi:localization factor PodJL